LDPAGPVEKALKGSPLVVFDLDGTLFELEIDWKGLLEEMTMMAYESRFVGRFKDIVEAYDWCKGRERAKERMVLLQREYEGRGSKKARRLAPCSKAARWRTSRGMKCALFSLNTSETAEGLLSSWGFYPMVTVDRCERLKPDPEGLISAMEIVGARPIDTVFVGSSERDRSAAKAAGVMFIDVKDIEETWFE
jgi:phosphoglycolate phosphatase-like HAD superfamily hydrolase